MDQSNFLSMTCCIILLFIFRALISRGENWILSFYFPGFDFLNMNWIFLRRNLLQSMEASVFQICCRPFFFSPILGKVNPSFSSTFLQHPFPNSLLSISFQRFSIFILNYWFIRETTTDCSLLCLQQQPLIASPAHYLFQVFLKGVTFFTCTQVEMPPLIAIEVISCYTCDLQIHWGLTEDSINYAIINLGSVRFISWNHICRWTFCVDIG
jgi:hypothetical protein